MTSGLAYAATPASGEAALESPNIITLLHHYLPGFAVVEFLHHFEDLFFSAVVIFILALIARKVSRQSRSIPGRLQNFVELIVESLDNFVVGVMGPVGRQYTPFVGTLFLYILCMNLIGIIPAMKSPTSNVNTTIALALTVFVYVQYTGLRHLGLLGYLDHLAGSPRPQGVIGCLIAMISVPFNLVLHLLGELTKPMSLAIRLFGNIFGEDVLLGQMLLLGIAALGFMHSPVGIPLQLPFYLLAILTSAIQALVFSLLSTIYIFLMLPHEEGARH